MPDRSPIETGRQARDLEAEVDALSDTGRSYMLSWLVFCTEPAERRIVGAAIDKGRAYETELDRIRAAGRRLLAQVAGS